VDENAHKEGWGSEFFWQTVQVLIRINYIQIHKRQKADTDTRQDIRMNTPASSIHSLTGM
jgi:hypothetical protein